MEEGGEGKRNARASLLAVSKRLRSHSYHGNVIFTYRRGDLNSASATHHLRSVISQLPSTYKTTKQMIVVIIYMH